MSTEETASRDACPDCGEHRLAVIEFPTIPTAGYQPYNELLGMGEAHEQSAPAIGCLACGAEWRDLDEFRATVRAARLRKPEIRSTHREEPR